jgi:cation diffusion facilitator family transporter
MPRCCDNEVEIARLRGRQAVVLKVVLALNAAMFVIEVFAGILAGSTALLADSLDMLGDALVYGLSLYVIAKNEQWRAIAVLTKGLIMAAFGLGVLSDAIYKGFHPFVPVAATMGVIGLLALAANTACLVLLWRHRQDDLNMRSTWLCSRNDVIANFSVLLAAVGVWSLNSMWPDLLIGSMIAILFLHSAFSVIKESLKVW